MKNTIESFLRNISSAVIILLILFSNLLSQTNQNANTDSKVFRFVKKYLSTVESGNRNQIKKFINEYFDSSFTKRVPIDYQVTVQMARYYESAGLGYEFNRLLTSKNDELKAELTNNLTLAKIELSISFSGKNNYKIKAFPEFKPILNNNLEPSEERMDNDQIIDRLNKCLDLMANEDDFSGVVLFAQNGVPLFDKAFGFASKSYEVPNKLDTKFNLASVGKIFTGIAIAQLVEKGKLSFTDTLSKFISAEWLNPEISSKIQIRHLLTHTSGLGDYFGKLYSQCDKIFFRDLNDYKNLISGQTLMFEPGTKWSYSNTGMLLLGVVVEKITGLEYFEYLRKYIFEPARMKNTDAFEKDRSVSNRATGYFKEYTNEGIKWFENSATRVLKGSPSGGCYSTAEDLLSFDKALRAHILINPKFTNEVLLPKPEINSPFYGYGFFIYEVNNKKIIRHSGDGTGVNCQYSSYIDSGYTVIVLSNYSRPTAEVIDNVLYQMLAFK